MVYESLSKRLVVQVEDTPFLVHPAKSKLHCCLIVFLGQVSILWSSSKV
jgi:hypothetical protein